MLNFIAISKEAGLHGDHGPMAMKNRKITLK